MLIQEDKQQVGPLYKVVFLKKKEKICFVIYIYILCCDHSRLLFLYNMVFSYSLHCPHIPCHPLAVLFSPLRRSVPLLSNVTPCSFRH